MKKEKAILFDFDGTLINSQPIINDYLDHIFAFRNITVSDAEKKKLGGMSFAMMRAYLSEKRGITFNIIERKLYNLWFVMRHLRDIRKFEHVDEVLKQLKSEGYKLGIVTNSPRSYISYIMLKEGLNKYFDATVSVTESKLPKPDPKMAVMAARKLKVPFSGCTLVDDNEPGITAGNALGMQTVRISDKKTSTKANNTIKTIEEVMNVIKKGKRK